MSKLIATCVTGVLVSLLLVGVISATFVRHVVQVTPILLVLVALWRGSRLTPYFALPIFVIWFLLMMLIWSYLLGFETFFTGSFTKAEIVLTGTVGLCCAIGMAACLRSNSSPILHRLGAFVISTCVQVAAMWLSFTPTFANR